jgi:hypothetical protein
MTRIHTNARPMDFTRGLQPMAREDERFWHLWWSKPAKKGLLQRILGRVK